MKIAFDSKQIFNELYPDGADHYPQLKKLFKGCQLKIALDHPVGEDVLFVDGLFKGYADDWVAALKIAEDFNIKYASADELVNKVDDFIVENNLIY